MTYKEFRKWCQENGYECVDIGSQLLIQDNVRCYASVDKEKVFWLSIYWDSSNQKEFFEKMVELAGTPLEEREEPKRYIVKIPAGSPDAFCALAKDGSNLYMSDDSDPDITNDYKLTEEEIKSIDPRFMAFAVEVE